MGIGFHHFEKNQFYNRVDNPALSGDSVLPFIGSRFNYSPVPMGPEVPVYRSYLSEMNASGYVPKNNLVLNTAFANQSTINNYGPVNSIYEIEINGIQTSGNNCGDCTLLNGKYYVQYREMSTNVFSNYNSILFNQGNPENANYWLGHVCNDSIQNRNIRCGDFKYIALAFYKNDGRLNYSNIWSSGQYAANVIIYGNDNAAAYGIGPTYINIFGSGDNVGRKYLLEESLSLSPSISGLVTYHAATGVYSCDYSNSTCIVRPYRNGLFDLNNTSNVKSNHKLFPFFFGYHSILGDVIIPESGHTQIIPSYFDVTFSGVPNIVSYSSCIPCNEYFSQTFRLKGPVSQLDISSRVPVSYFWSQEQTYYSDYMNIGDYGCDTITYKGVDPPICFKGIKLDITGDGFARLLIDATDLINYTSTIKLSKYLGSQTGINLCNSSIFDSTGWDYSLSGTIPPTTFPISSLCNFSGTVPIITPVCQSGICECVYSGPCIPLCSDLRHPKTIIASFTIPSEGIVRNAEYTASNIDARVWRGPRSNYISVNCPNFPANIDLSAGFPNSYTLSSYVTNGSCSGQSVTFISMTQPRVYQDRYSFNCSNLINGSGNILYFDTLGSPCFGETFPVTYTLQDFV